MGNHSRRKTGLGTVCLLTAALTLAASGAGADSFELHDGVLVSVADGAVYVMATQGGIDALDLDSGNVIWHNDQAAKPLAVDNHTLIAQGEATAAGELPLVVFDTRGTGVPTHNARLPLPAHVRGQAEDTLRNSFTAKAEIVDGQVQLHWKSQIRPAKGISPQVREDLTGPVDATGKSLAATVPPSAALIDSGAALLDLASGEVRSTAALKSMSASGVSLTELTGVDRLAGVDGRQFLSADGRHVLASIRNADKSRHARHTWLLHDRQTGERVGTTAQPISASPFLVVDGALVLVTPPQTYPIEGDWAIESIAVRSFDLATGAQLWSKAVRDAEYSGPMPH